MDRIDFEAKPDASGLICIADEYTTGLAKQKTIHLTTTTLRPERKTVKRMKENTFRASGFKPLTHVKRFTTARSDLS
jgi:hypothetical protein